MASKRRSEDFGGLRVSSRQARWYRFCRSGLAAEKFFHSRAAAHQLVGVHAQILSSSKLALSARVAMSEDHDNMEAYYLQELESLVRIQGMRGTIHSFDPPDWPTVCAAVADREIRRMEKRYEERGAKRMRPDLRNLEEARTAVGDLLKQSGTASKAELTHVGDAVYGAFLTFCLTGVASRVDSGINDSPTIALRTLRFPHLQWVLPSYEEALADIARRFFACYGPASVKDLQNWAGCSPEQAQRALRDVQLELKNVIVEGEDSQSPQFICIDQEPLLMQLAPPPEDWPVRLLGSFDPMLVAHVDKGLWIDAAYKPQVWTHTTVRAVLLIDGRIQGIWHYRKASNVLTIDVQSFQTLDSDTTAKLQLEADRIAATLGAHTAKVRLS